VVRGHGLAVFAELGVNEIHGVDGDYVNRDKLVFDSVIVTAVDLSRAFKIAGRYDLAICVEVAEHLPRVVVAVLCKQALTQASSLVLFSAAVPG
jgi:2-polyprenyl-3-methyl-5-hydroxy-6-metoxy-1,4-benzoquinol methylase